MTHISEKKRLFVSDPLDTLVKAQKMSTLNKNYWALTPVGDLSSPSCSGSGDSVTCCCPLQERWKKTPRECLSQSESDPPTPGCLCSC